jgi:L-ascorbate metabolism protein UlaG (beta-lactamase superfamily)
MFDVSAPANFEPRRLVVKTAAPHLLRGGRYHGPVTDHFDGRFFFNPGRRMGKGLRDYLKWHTSGGRARWPRRVHHRLTAKLPERLSRGEVGITFINHSTFLLQFAGMNVLTDPIYSQRVSPLRWIGPRRVHPPGLPWDALPHIDVVLLSHDHYDHLDLPTIHRLERRFHPLYVVPLGNRGFLESEGVQRVVELDWWGSVEAGAGARVTLTPALHWSGRGVGREQRHRTLWGGFQIEHAHRRVFFAGDSGWAGHFAEIRERLGQPDLALLPIGAYEPRWFMRDVHMNPEEAVLAHQALGARQSIAAHFGTFQLTNEGIDDPVRELEAQRVTKGVSPEEFAIPQVGGTVVVS